MGGHISSEKQDMFEQERKEELKLISKKFKRVDQRNVLLVGPQQSGRFSHDAAHWPSLVSGGSLSPFPAASCRCRSLSRLVPAH